jgi:hypothetical protein
VKRYKLLTWVFGTALLYVGAIWIGNRAQDQIRTRDIAAAQAKIDLFNTGFALGKGTLLLQLQRANKIEPDTSVVRQVAEFNYMRDSLIWERERIKNDTLKMPVRSK